MKKITEYSLTKGADGKPIATPLNNTFPKVRLNNSLEIYKYIEQFWGSDINFIESCIALYLDQKNNVLGWAKISLGGISQCIVDVRVILKYGIDLLASSIVIAHNHPSNDTTPSKCDDTLTEQLKNACKIMNFRFLDHLIISPEKSYYSYSDNWRIL